MQVGLQPTNCGIVPSRDGQLVLRIIDIGPSGERVLHARVILIVVVDAERWDNPVGEALELWCELGVMLGCMDLCRYSEFLNLTLDNPGRVVD